MRTAVVFAGQARTFKQCWPNQFWNVLRKLDNPIIYSCVEDDEQADDMELLRDRFAKVHTKKVKCPTDLPTHNPKLADHSASVLKGSVQNLMRQIHMRREAWEFFDSCQQNSRDEKAEMIVLMRGDLFFRDFILPPAPHPFDVYSLWWARSGGLNDRISLSGPEAFHAQMVIPVDELLKAGCALHMESLVSGSVELAACRNYPKLHAWCQFKRLNGETVEPDCTMGELALASRGL